MNFQAIQLYIYHFGMPTFIFMYLDLVSKHLAFIKNIIKNLIWFLDDDLIVIVLLGFPIICYGSECFKP